MIKTELQGVEELKRQLAMMRRRGSNLKPLLLDIAGIMHDEVEENFQSGGRDPEWPASKRVKQHGGQTLIDSAQLVNSIQKFVTGYSSGVFTNKAYAAIHNFGGEIKRQPYSGLVRLRTDARGSLLRQGLRSNLAVFARSSHKRAVERSFSSTGYTIHMPQREYMKISAAGVGRIEAAAAAFIAS